MSNSNFDVVNHDNALFEPASVSGLVPRFSFLKLYPGGEYEGWLAFLVNGEDESLLFTFMPGFMEDGNRRYLSLQPSGR